MENTLWWRSVPSPYIEEVDEGVGDEDRRRWVALEGAFNCRDLGGYTTADGSRVRWGSVFRSDALQLLSTGDLRQLQSLGVDRVIDLRSPGEIATVGRGSLAEGTVRYLTASVIPSLSDEALGAPPGDDIAQRYLWYLDVGRDALAMIFENLAEEGRGAVVFHCAAGKDRTGVLAALLLSVLGVGEDDIIADYALTNRAMPSILERLARDPRHGKAVAQMPASRRMVLPDTMRRFLELLDLQHGGARTWMESAGVAPGSVDRLRRQLLIGA
jgi:hypothetical protein